MSTPFSTAQAADLWRLLPDTLRHYARRHRQYAGVVPTKLPNGDLAWPRDAVIASLPDADLDESQRESLQALQHCTGPLRLAPGERAALLGLVHSLPHEHRHDADRLLAQFDLAERIVGAADRAELTHPVDRGGQVTRLSPHAQRQLAAAAGRIADRVQQIRARLLAAAEGGAR